MGTRPRTLAETQLRFYRLTHERLLTVSEGLNGDQFRWSAGPSLHSVAWQLWHCARWDDVLAAHINRDLERQPLEQVWDRESVAKSWSLTPGSMGRRDAGTDLSGEDAEKINFPAQEEVIDYARRAFVYVEDAVAAIPDELLLEAAKNDPDGDTNLDNVIIYLEHLSRHLGMIESIRGLQGLDGSSTR
jgi:hypothetical protein